MDTITLSGSAFSPINAYWGSLGTVEATFDVSGGTPGHIPGQTVNETVTNFKLTLDGIPLSQGNATGVTYKGDYAVFMPNGTFAWVGNGGAWQGESNAYTFVWSKMDVTQHSTPEPSALWLAWGAVVGFAIYRVMKAIR